MPFRRNRQVVKRDKHEVTFTDLSKDASTFSTILLASGVDVGAKTGSTDVAIGSHLYGIYCEFNVGAETVTSAKTLHWKVEMHLTGQTASAPTLYYQPDRSQILKRGMEMLPKNVSTQTKRIFFVRIPKGYQRMKEGMSFSFHYGASSSQTINICGIFIYKEIY